MFITRSLGTSKMTGERGLKVDANKQRHVLVRIDKATIVEFSFLAIRSRKSVQNHTSESKIDIDSVYNYMAVRLSGATLYFRLWRLWR